MSIYIYIILCRQEIAHKVGMEVLLWLPSLLLPALPLHQKKPLRAAFCGATAVAALPLAGRLVQRVLPLCLVAFKPRSHLARAGVKRGKGGKCECRTTHGPFPPSKAQNTPHTRSHLHDLLDPESLRVNGSSGRKGQRVAPGGVSALLLFFIGHYAGVTAALFLTRRVAGLRRL